MAAEPTDKVFTIGYRGRSPGDVVEELKTHGIEVVIDVRAVPESSVEGFSGDDLGPLLLDAGLDYVPLGELGAFQPEAYETYMDDPAWKEAYAKLLDHARRARTCLFAPEANVAASERALIGRRLQEDGFRVVHLTPAGPREAITFEG